LASLAVTKENSFITLTPGVLVQDQLLFLRHFYLLRVGERGAFWRVKHGVDIFVRPAVDWLARSGFRSGRLHLQGRQRQLSPVVFDGQLLLGLEHPGICPAKMCLRFFHQFVEAFVVLACVGPQELVEGDSLLFFLFWFAVFRGALDFILLKKSFDVSGRFFNGKYLKKFYKSCTYKKFRTI
jgi:hypothetical protein